MLIPIISVTTKPSNNTLEICVSVKMVKAKVMYDKEEEENQGVAEAMIG